MTNPIPNPKHHWVFKGNPLIKAVADKAKAEGYRVFLNIGNESCFPEGTSGFITPQDGSKLLYFQMQDFNMYVQFSIMVVPSHRYGNAYGLNYDCITCLEAVEKILDIKGLMSRAKPIDDEHGLYTLNMKMNDHWGLRNYAEY